MEYYIDLRILKDPEFSEPQLMSALYAKLHRALVSLDGIQIAVSFPQQGKEGEYALGSVLRLYGTEKNLSTVMQLSWMQGMRDHVLATEITKVPVTCKYRTIKRIQCDSSPERLKRRYKKRHGVDDEQLMDLFKNFNGRFTRLPFVSLMSASTQQRFRIFFEFGELREEPLTGKFNTYGLSSTATIPWF